MRHTRDCWAGRPVPYFVLHRIGFSLPPASRPARWALTPPFHPYPSTRRFRGMLRAVSSLWHCPSRGFEPPCPGLSGSASGRWPCGLPCRRDSVSCRESCPRVSGLSSPNRQRSPGLPRTAGAQARVYPRRGMFPKNGATTWPQDQGGESLRQGVGRKRAFSRRPHEAPDARASSSLQTCWLRVAPRQASQYTMRPHWSQVTSLSGLRVSLSTLNEILR